MEGLVVLRRKNAVFAGMKGSIPILLGYLPIGVAYGLLAVKSGLNAFETVAMSIFVFAGSAQLISVNMIAVGAGIFPIVMMTFLVNIRHILMSASLSLKFKEGPTRLLPLLGFIITDESFAVSSVGLEEQENKEMFFLGLALTAYFGWVFSSFIGAILGSILPIGQIPGLDFVLPAMFIVLLVMQIRDKKQVFVAIISAAFSLFFIYILPDNWNIILATILAATAGIILESGGRLDEN